MPPVATSFDLLNKQGSDHPLYAWFESGLKGHTDRLPASRRLVSAADTGVLFELQPYTNNNVLLLTAAKPSGKLVLVEPPAYRCLFILAAGGAGDSTVALQLHFSDGTTSEFITFQAPDCSLPETNSNVALRRQGRRSGEGLCACAAGRFSYARVV